MNKRVLPIELANFVEFYLMGLESGERSPHSLPEIYQAVESWGDRYNVSEYLERLEQIRGKDGR